MKKKRRHDEISQPECEQIISSLADAEPNKELEAVQEPEQKSKPPVQSDLNQNHRHKKIKQVYQRVNVDPTRRYQVHEQRESWGPNVKGRKFRKEKGKKKRCPNAGVRIDGTVKSVRLDA